MLARYASDPVYSRGRLVDECHSAHRSAFQRDRDRIIHSTAFRRLKYKTQVFVEHEADHFRTRLTHSIEVSQVARTIAGVLNLNVELTEAIALAHDLGHTPFGHAGEDALDVCMAPFGGFDHNAQAIKIVTDLERHYADFNGLNLTWDCLEGIAKHNGPVLGQVPYALAEYNLKYDLELHTHANAEAQVAAISDDIAYNNHDLDDGLRAGLFTIEDIVQLPLVGDAFAEVDKKYPNLDQNRRRYEALRRVFSVLVDDVIRHSSIALDKSCAITAADIRSLGHPVITFSNEVLEGLNAIRKFLYTNMYRAPSVMAVREEMTDILRSLFYRFMTHPHQLPEGWDPSKNDLVCARLVADYVSGMTDRYALKLHKAASVS